MIYLTIRNRDAAYEITVTANSGSFLYDGTEKTVDGLAATRFELEGVKYEVTGLTARASATDAGEYTVKVTGIPKIVDEKGNHFLSKILEKGQPYPCESTRRYTTYVDNQTAVEINIYEAGSDAEDIDEIDSHDLYGSLLLDNIRVAPKGTPSIDVTFSYDKNQVLEITAEDQDTHVRKQILIRENEKAAINPPKPALDFMLLLDASGSMSGDRIAAVNSAMNETMEVLKDVSKNNPTAELKIGVLQFASGASWITDKGLVFMDDFYWNDLKAGGLTDLGVALEELDKKLSRSAFLNSSVGYKVPVIIFMSDGGPTDDYEAAVKIAIAVGDGADREVLAKIVGNPEAVIRVDDLETLKKLIRVVSVTASVLGSQSRSNNDASDDIIKGIKDQMGMDTEDDKSGGKGGDGTGVNPDKPEEAPPQPGDWPDWPDW